MKNEECFGCKYLSSKKKVMFCGYREAHKGKYALPRRHGLENIKNISVCYNAKAK